MVCKKSPVPCPRRRLSSLRRGHPILLLLRLYKWTISPLLPAACRFYPTCSEYAYEAVQRFGICSGGILTLKRLLKCHPWGGSGIDTVPEVTGLRKDPLSKS